MPRGNFPKGNKVTRTGVPNKITRQVKEMIEGALEELGGQKWLVAQGRKHPTAFMTLLGRVLPRDIKLKAEVEHTLFDLVMMSYQQGTQSPSLPAPAERPVIEQKPIVDDGNSGSRSH